MYIVCIFFSNFYLLTHARKVIDSGICVRAEGLKNNEIDVKG